MLDYIALLILVLAALILFYGIIVIHDIPYEIAVHREHPHQDAIHVAGWISLLTLHIIWPFLWIWATLYRKERGWGFNTTPEGDNKGANLAELTLRLEQQNRQIAALQASIAELHQATAKQESK